MKRVLSFLSVFTIFFATTSVFSACSPKRAQVKITLSNDKELVYVLYKDYAPKTVAHFLQLCEDKYYDGVALSDFEMGRILFGEYEWNDDFTDLDTKDTEGIENLKGDEIDGWSIEIQNNPLLHSFGTLSFYNDKQEGGSYDSAKVKLFISTNNNSNFDGKYAIFGKLLNKASEEVLREILEEQEKEREDEEYAFGDLNERFEINLPFDPIFIKTISIIKR